MTGTRRRGSFTREGSAAVKPDLFAGKHVMLKGARELRAEDVAPQVRARFASRLRARTWTRADGVEITCTEWQGALNTDGHGVVQIVGRPRQRFALAHRLAYAIAHDVCPGGLVVDHFACDNRRCCDPAHLRLTTPEGNTPAIYGSPSTIRREPPARPLRAIVDGQLVTYPSVDACFADMERRAVARHGPRCEHGFFYCTKCQRPAARPSARAVANTWSDEPGGANVAEGRVSAL